MTRRALLPLLAAMALLATATSRPATACTSTRCLCMVELTVNEARDRAYEIFVGKIISLHDTSALAFSQSQRDAPAKIARLAVTTRWKGSTDDTTSVWSFEASGVCGVTFAVGEEWLLFIDEGSRRIHLCGLSNRTDKAKSVLRELGRPKPVRSRDSVELAVLRVVRDRVLSGRPAAIDASSTYATACDERARPTFCINDSAYVHFRVPLNNAARDMLMDAATDFRRRNESPSAFPPSTVRELRGKRAVSASERCDGVGLLAFTRVGFEASMEYAVAGYVFTVGAGPYPGCGYLTAATYFLQRTRTGAWEIIGESAVRMT